MSEEGPKPFYYIEEQEEQEVTSEVEKIKAWIAEPVKTSWTPEEKRLVDWVLNAKHKDMPEKGFEIRPRTGRYKAWEVKDPKEFLTILKRQVSYGPNYVRAVMGGLQKDIKMLISRATGVNMKIDDIIHDDNDYPEDSTEGNV